MTETRKQHRFDDLLEGIKKHGPLFDSIELSVSTIWDEKGGAYRYCRMVRFEREPARITLWIHTFKGDLTHVIYSENGNDEYIEADQFVWGYPSEWGLREMINKFIAEVAG
jgi:hypothetical protein